MQRRRNALEHFLPEFHFGPDAQPSAGTAPIEPSEIDLDPLDGRAHAPHVIELTDSGTSSQVQPWPMVAAAMVAIGVSLLAVAALARFGP